MADFHEIPFVFGVTGHRDVRDEDVPELEESVRSLFLHYQTECPHTQLIVISALAEGADMLVVRVAMELGVTLHVLIPYEEAAYLDAFEGDAGREQYGVLKRYASDFRVNRSLSDYSAQECYAWLGRTIADASTILIALWDGVDNGKKGGTAAVVIYRREGDPGKPFRRAGGQCSFPRY